MKKNILRRTLHKIKYLLGIQGYSDYFKKYFDTANANSGIVVSLIVIVLEIYMISYVLFHVLTSSKVRSPLWIVQHFSAYVILLTMGVILLIHSRLYLKDRHPSRKFGNAIRIIFSISCIIFGIYISYLDYCKGEQILSFLTMIVFILGLFVWDPFASIFLNGGAFILFVVLISYAKDSSGQQIPLSFATKLNLFTFWLSVQVVSFTRYYQKFLEAKKAEHIENINGYLGEIALTDEETGISNMVDFRNKVGDILKNDSLDYYSRIFLFLDVHNFKNYNEKYGFDQGSQFLSTFAHTLKYTFKDDPVAHASDDHFVVFAYKSGVEEKLLSLKNKLIAIDDEVKLSLKTGSFIPSDVSTSTNTACDYARYACESIKKKSDVDYCEYTTAIAEDLTRKQYIINNIETAIEKGYIHIYYQPVVLSKNKELCGFEALARWIDPKYGFLPPYAFISILEEYRLIHKLDAFIVKKVCQDIIEAPENHIPVFPISVNFSKLDFELMDVEKLLEECVEKQNINKDSIHIEVTESALSNNDQNLKEILNRLHQKNYSLWLDDFGSGYSGLNILKEYEFDMMKIDMAFVRNFDETPKTKPILKNIVTLANDIGMHTLSEGVETEDAYQFLKEIGCERIQGYLFGKPMPREEIFVKIKNGELYTSKKIK